MQEAIDQIRQELGPNAVILHSRKVNRGGVLNLLSKPVIEVTAAVDVDAAREQTAEPEPRRESSDRARRSDFAPRDELAPRGHRLAAYLDSARAEQNRLEVERADSTRRSVGADDVGGPIGVVESIRRELVSHDVNELLAEALVRSAVEELHTTDNEALIKEYIQKRIERFVRVTGPLKCEAGKAKVIALVGPTGVGKTTTVAKLAAHYTAVERKNVAIITVDVYRVAAVEQMRVYAQLLKVPIEVVLTPTDLRGTLAAHRDKDLILIDSGGRSQYNWMQVLELTGFFKELSDVDIHLVLSAATRAKENMAVIDRFSSMPITGLLITKLDETRDYGSLLTLAVKSKRPISYLTAGQSIPEDIEPASPAKLARMILHTEAERKLGPIERPEEQRIRVEQYASYSAR
jgi:flagellar biosynthesis protein FlhF